MILDGTPHGGTCTINTMSYLSNLSVLLEDGAKGLVGRLPRKATDENLLVHL